MPVFSSESGPENPQHGQMPCLYGRRWPQALQPLTLPSRVGSTLSPGCSPCYMHPGTSLNTQDKGASAHTENHGQHSPHGMSPRSLALCIFPSR